MRRPRALTRPGGVVWQSFVPDTARGQLAVFDMAETRNQENGIVVMASVDQTNDTLTMCRCHISSCRFWSQKQGWKIVLEDCKTAWISQGVWSTPYQRNPSVITQNYNAVCSKICQPTIQLMYSSEFRSCVLKVEVAAAQGFLSEWAGLWFPWT